MKYTSDVTIDEILAILEDCGNDVPVIIETVHHGDIERHYFDSCRVVRKSREYTGDVFLGIDPVIWYESLIDEVWRDPNEDIGVITLKDDEEE